MQNHSILAKNMAKLDILAKSWHLTKIMISCSFNTSNRPTINKTFKGHSKSLKADTSWLRLERYQKSYPIPNTDICFLSCLLLELDMKSEVCCANRAASLTALTTGKHWFALLCQHLHSAHNLTMQCPFTLCSFLLSLWLCHDLVYTVPGMPSEQRSLTLITVTLHFQVPTCEPVRRLFSVNLCMCRQWR